jgi:hypothetical protein
MGIQPKLGEVREAKEVGHKGHGYYAWSACEGCRKERWVALRKGNPESLLCRSCIRKTLRGSKSPIWKGGRHKDSKGYVLIQLAPEDFFYTMVNGDDNVLEHRLVMAKHLGRCLQPWEIVHHKNHIRDDNRIENLQVVSDDRHMQITILENKIIKLEKEVKLLKWHIKELEEKKHTPVGNR